MNPSHYFPFSSLFRLLLFFFFFFFFFFLSLPSPASAQSSPVSFADLREEKEDAVKEFARDLRARFALENWCTSGNTCNQTACARHNCEGTIGEKAECQYDIIASCDCNSDTLERQCSAKDINNDLCKDVSSALYTPGPGNNTGQLLNKDEPAFRVPKGSITSEGEGKPIVIASTSLRRDICSLKQEANNLRDFYNSNKFSAWFYAGTEYGGFMTFPGHPQCRDENLKGEDRIHSCNYNPTERPWYITAATGDRDIVFMYDRNLAASSVLARAFGEALNTTDERDAVSVRSFEQKPDTSDLLNGDSANYTLSFATAAQKRNVIGKLPTTGIAERANLTAALTDAFRVLRESNTSTNCYRFIVLMLGSDDVCFTECSSGRCGCVSKLIQLVNDQQRLFTDGTKATIVAFTQGSGTSTADELRTSRMERVASSLACTSSGGMWHGVSSDDDENTAMTAFTQVSSLLQYDDRESPNVFGTDVYTDASGLGLMVTLSAPVYDFNGRRLVSVVGVDILLSEILNRTGLSTDAAKQEIAAYSRQSRECRKEDAFSECDAQALRFNHRNSNVCPVAKEPASKGDCFRLREAFYWRSNYTAKFTSAQEACQKLSSSGTLAILGDEDTARDLAALVDDDGSWIGLRGVGGNLTWVNGSTAVLRGSEFPYDVSKHSLDSQCVAMDRRGIIRNWDLEDCSNELYFICAFDEAACSSDLSNATAVPLDTKSCADLNRVAERLCEGFPDDDIDGADPFCRQTGTNYSESDRLCCGGRADPKAATAEGNGNDGGGSIAGIAGGVVAAVVAAAVVIFAIVFTRRKKEKRRAEEAAHEGGKFPNVNNGAQQRKTGTKPSDGEDVEGLAGGVNDRRDTSFDEDFTQRPAPPPYVNQSQQQTRGRISMETGTDNTPFPV